MEKREHIQPTWAIMNWERNVFERLYKKTN